MRKERTGELQLTRMLNIVAAHVDIKSCMPNFHACIYIRCFSLTYSTKAPDRTAYKFISGSLSLDTNENINLRNKFFLWLGGLNV